jgi:hypothetical protein
MPGSKPDDAPEYGPGNVTGKFTPTGADHSADGGGVNVQCGVCGSSDVHLVTVEWPKRVTKHLTCQSCGAHPFGPDARE